MYSSNPVEINSDVDEKLFLIHCIRKCVWVYSWQGREWNDKTIPYSDPSQKTNIINFRLKGGALGMRTHPDQQHFPKNQGSYVIQGCLEMEIFFTK